MSDTKTMRAPVFFWSSEGSGVQEVVMPKNGICSPARPACWSDRIPRTPPLLSSVMDSVMACRLARSLVPDFSRSFLMCESM